MSLKLPKSMLWCLLITLLMGAWVGTAQAQVLYGSVVGTVTDQSGAVVPGARVIIVQTTTGTTREVTSDEGGRYTVISLLPGLYDLRLTATGFRPYEQKGVTVAINQVTRTDVTLQVGPVAEQVTVEATAVALQTDKSDVHTEITKTAVTNLPLPNYRNYQSLINLVPGATPSGFQNATVDTPARSLTTNVNGTARNNNNTRVDGAANVYIWLPHHTLYNPPVDAVETVNVTTSSFDAEQGMSGGAAITLTTKSGTNDLHGTGTWYHDNQRLKARPYFMAPTVKKPKGINNIGSGTIGGPVKKNKLFYFFSFERTMERSGQSGNWSVPPADIRTGDFSKYTDLAKIYDPMTGNADGSGRTAFQDNKIPDARISPIFKKIQALAPLPNQAAADKYGLQNNFGATGTQALDRNQYDVKVNWNTTSKLMIWGKYSRMDALVNGPPVLGELVGDATLGTLGTGDTTVNIPTFGYNYTFSPTFLMDGVFGYTRFDQFVFGPDYGKNWGSEVWGIPGTNGGKAFAGDVRYQGMPCITQGFTGWGNCNTWMPVWRNDRSYLYTTNFSKVRAAHEFRFGFDMIRHELNHWQPETANPRGAINFSSLNTQLKGQSGQSINTYAAALLGVVNNYTKSIQFFDMKTREWQFAGYVRDNWRATRNLTVNLGLRYEYYPLINRGDRGIERWDPATNIVYFGGLGGTPSNAGITVSKKLFAPRIGLAYRLGDKTVVRAGYGISYDPLPFGRPLRGLYPATLTGSYVALEQYGYYNTLAEGIPEIPTPDVSKGQAVLPPTVDMGPRSPWGGELHRGYIQSWNLTVERRLPLDTVASVAYVGTQTIHQLLDIDINAAPVGTGTAGRPLVATQNRRIGASMWDGWATGSYHALQAQANRNFTRGLYLKASYTYSKTINLSDEDGWAGMPLTNILSAIRRNRATSGYDRRQMFVAAWVYELPVGNGKRFDVKSGLANAIVGGWKVNGIFSAYTGTPFTVSASTSSLNAPGSSQTADIIGAPNKLGAVGPGTTFIDPSIFRDPNWDRPANTYRFGTGGRNTVYGPGFIRPDVGLFKNFKITERVNLEFRAEAMNFTNTPRFNNPGANVSNITRNADGSIKNLNNFMAITGTAALSERQWRFGLRLAF